MNGSNILVMVDRGSVGSPDYQVLGCQRDATFEETSDTIDQSCKTQRSMRVIPGRYAANVSLDFLYVEGLANYLYLKNANRQGLKLILAREEFGAITQRAIAKIDSISDAFPDQAESVVSAAFTLDGVIADAWIIGEGILGSAYIG